MKITFHSKGFFFGDVAREYVEHRLGFALGRFQNSVRRITVHVEDLNGPRGGIDKNCRLQIYLNGVRGPVMMSVKERTITAAIDIAADRARHTVARTLNRRSNRRSRNRHHEEHLIS